MKLIALIFSIIFLIIGMAVFQGISGNGNLENIVDETKINLNDETGRDSNDGISRDLNVEKSASDHIVNLTRIPDDPYFNRSWSLHNTGQTGGTPDADIDAPEAWGLQTGSNDEVIIAVIDTGVDYTHPDLAANIWTNPGEIPGNGIDDDLNGFVDDVHGWDFANNDNDPYDDDYTGHGTHCAGIIGASGNDSVGIAGVNRNVKIMPLKFFDSNGFGTTDDAISCIKYASMMGADIISNSWGELEYNRDLKDAISAAGDSGILFVTAAGDYRLDTDHSPYYPACYDVPCIVSVAATDHNDQLSFLSNYGAVSIDLGAPGVEIYSTVPGNSYAYNSGSSMAVPHVAGVAGLIKAQNPKLTCEELKEKLLAAVDPVPSLEGKTVTGGRLNAYNCLETDSVPPSGAAGLTVVNRTFYSVTLAWTASGDDGNIGIAKLYDIRYSTSPLTDLNWDSAVKVSGEPKPKRAGSSETFKVTGLLNRTTFNRTTFNSTTYYFGIKVIDNVGNPSELSEVSETTTTPVIVFQDSMENGIGEWTHSGTGDNWEHGSPASGPGCAYSGSSVWATNLSGNYGTESMNASLVSPQIDLSGISSAQLTFQHFYNTDTGYDGAIVEISSDGGNSWTQLTPSGGYPAIIDDSNGNPLGPVPAYSSYTGARWHEAVFDISAFKGKNVNIRFRFGTDRAISRFSGWYIDDVVVRGEIPRE